ncbi:endolytic transglycosylase MltG [Streptomyces marincola]|uniref:endolytic transglycosylase MltG n=1 Tax=Streptomyces marincola TaxID=2878388 RepID=UPI001CF15CBF|nr:endolytic transglycosylase MltG [Streptomyces marincola]UCM86805.1 endolytic transglycosylase MltG [Streptomyces marincola]
MTDDGRNPGSEPWYPDDPRYADQGWSGGYEGAGGHPAQQGSWQHHYGAQQQYHGQQYDAQPGYDGQQYGGQQYGDGGPYASNDPHYGDGQQYHQQQPYQGQGGWESAGGHYGQGYGEDPYATAGQPGPVQDPGGFQGAYGADQGYPGQPYDTAGHQPGQDGHPYASDQQYAGQPGHPAAPRPEHERQQAPGAVGGQPGERRREPEPDPETGWDPGPDQGELDFFRREDEDGDEGRAGDSGRGSGRRGDRQKSAKRRRGGRGCAVAAVLVLAGVGGVGYYGYDFYQERFGPAPDYQGEGTGEVQVTIPDGATVSQMANILREAGVVRSHDAFVDAAGGQALQAGVYTLREQMSAESAVAMMLNGEAVGGLIIPEGRRATEVYTMIDEYLGLAEGATAEAAEAADLGLPDWAEGDPEGFLFPARYDVGTDTAPEEVLRQMVQRATAEFTETDLEGQAASIGRTPREVLVIASLIEAEGQSDEEFVRVSRVIHNRLEQNIRLEFDSTVNYALGRHTLDVSLDDTDIDSPYNTYEEFGLPPGPIANPGHAAIEAALNPADGPWLFFVTVRPGDTRFTDDYDEHLQNVLDFNAAQREAREQEGGE